MAEDIAALKYRDPSSMDYRAHTQHVRIYNDAIQAQLRRHLSSHLGDIVSETADFAILTMGSDGRLEKGPVSPIELAIYNRPAGYFTPNAEFLKIALKDVGAIHLVDEDIDERNLGEKNLSYVSMHRTDNSLVSVPSPGRVFDGSVIAGASAVYHEVFDRVLNEAKGPGGGRKLYWHMHRKARDHLRIVPSGIQDYKGTKIRHYSAEQGTAFYDGQHGRMSFKQGPLRAIQFSLVDDILRSVRAGLDHVYFQSLPTNTIDKLRALEVHGWTPLSQGELGDLVDCYQYFLWGYHRSQFNKRQCGERVTQFDAQEVKGRLEATHAILNKHKAILKHPKER